MEIIAGTHQGWMGLIDRKGLLMQEVKMFGAKKIYLNKESLASYEVLTEDIRKSATSGVARGLVGGALLGPVGLLAGGLSAKNKGTYQVVLKFHDGSESLAEMNEKEYNELVRRMF